MRKVRFIAPPLLPGGLELGTAPLLYLVHQEGQHHQRRQHHGQVLPAVSIVVFEMVTLIFQGVEGLVLDLPAGPSTAHDGVHVVGRQHEVGDPTEMLDFADSFDFLDDLRGMDFPVVEHVDQVVGVRFIERHAAVEAKVMQDARGRIVQGEGLCLAGFVVGSQVLEQKSVVAWLDADDVVRAGTAQVVQVRGVGAEGVLDDDNGQVGMLLAKVLQPAAGGIALAVVLGVAVLVDDRFGRQRNDFLEIRMD